MLPYPTELRERVVAAVEQGEHSIPEIAHLFQVGKTFIKKMLKLHRAGESLEPRRGKREQPLLKEKELALLRQEIEQQPDATLPELVEMLAAKHQVVVSPSTVCRAAQKLNLPRKKKSRAASERNEKQRKAFTRLVRAFALRKYIFVDEMGSNLALTRLYGRATPGQRVVEQVPANPGGNVSTIGAMALDGLRTGLSVNGSIDGETMLYFVEEMLAPTLKRGEIVFFDNCQIHKQEEILDAVEAKGAWAIFLPPYSPDFNPIENCWSKIKTLLRTLKPRSLEELLDAITEAFASITPAILNLEIGATGVI